ncbi:MAG: hypothetical protein OXT74_03000 [Candidatus Poribacteria bacterium]|nr:hypothetical protein [Candidatus Poribacteria bacterium]
MGSHLKSHAQPHCAAGCVEIQSLLVTTVQDLPTIGRRFHARLKGPTSRVGPTRTPWWRRFEESQWVGRNLPPVAADTPRAMGRQERGLIRPS